MTAAPAPPRKAKPRAAVPPKEDGRAVRSATTRRAVAEAYLNLLDAGEMRPTARAIAAEAGVSERAVFRHFQDMETLHGEAAILQIQRVGAEIPEPPSDSGFLSDRVALLARRWCMLNERVTPVRRVALLQEPFSPEIARRLRWVRKLARTEVEKTFAAELAKAGDVAARSVLAALSVAISWEAWNEIRQRHKLDAGAAERTVASILSALLASVESF